MKPHTTVLCFLIALGMLLAFPVSALAAGFDAEELYGLVFVIYSGSYYGSGFSIGENCIITNAHVIDDISSVEVKTYSGDILSASVAVFDEELDIAVLYVQDAVLDYLIVAEAEETGVGDDIYTIGAPNNLEYTLTKGIISAVQREIGGQQYYQIDAVIDNGNSGGPLVNEKGEVVGVNTMKLEGGGDIGFAIPMDAVCGCLEDAGIALFGSGNVKGRIDSMAITQQPKADQYEPEQTDRQNGAQGDADPAMLWIWAIVIAFALLSVTLILIIAKPKRSKADPDRTDFKIDFLK